jgi:hypothetical protein
MPNYLLVCSISYFVPLYLRDLINAGCNLSPRWGLVMIASVDSKHLRDLYGISITFPIRSLDPLRGYRTQNP